MALVALAAAAPVRAQDAIRILVGFPPGGGADLIARLAADKARDALGAQVIVENRPGAGGQIAAEALKNAAPDGKTLMASPVAVTVIAPLTHKKLAYDPEKDFAPVSLAVNFQLAFTAGPGTPATTLAEYIGWVKGDARRTSFGVPAAGSLPHFFGLLLGRAIGTELVHIPYKGGAPLLNDLIGGQIPAGVDVLSEAIPQHRAGKVRILASSGARRSPIAPEVPTFTELGYPQLETVAWMGLWVKPDTPVAVQAQIREAALKALASPSARERLQEIGFEPPQPRTPDELSASLKVDSERVGAILKSIGFKPE